METFETDNLNNLAKKLLSFLKKYKCSQNHDQLVNLFFTLLKRNGFASLEIFSQEEKHDSKCEEFERFFHFKLDISNKPKIIMNIRKDINYPDIKYHVVVQQPEDYFTITHIDEESLYNYIKSQLHDSDGVDDVDFVYKQITVEPILRKYKIKSLNVDRQLATLVERNIKLYSGIDNLNNFIKCSVNFSRSLDNIIQRLYTYLLSMKIKGYQVGVQHNKSNKSWELNIPKEVIFKLDINNYDLINKKKENYEIYK